MRNPNRLTFTDTHMPARRIDKPASETAGTARPTRRATVPSNTPSSNRPGPTLIGYPTNKRMFIWSNAGLTAIAFVFFAISAILFCVQCYVPGISLAAHDTIGAFMAVTFFVSYVLFIIATITLIVKPAYFYRGRELGAFTVCFGMYAIMSVCISPVVIGGLAMTIGFIGPCIVIGAFFAFGLIGLETINSKLDQVRSLNARPSQN